MRKFTNLIIVDASGSMTSKIEQVQEGLAGLLADIRKDHERYSNAEITTIILDFDNEINVLVNSQDPEDLSDQLVKAYRTRGSTALYDAIGIGLSMVPEDQTGIYVNILTDGHENASREYSGSDVKKLITEAKEKQWAVTFMGTDESSIRDAVQTLGVSRGNTYQFQNSAGGVKMASKTRAKAKAAYFSASMNDMVGSMNMESLMEDNKAEDED